MHTDTARSQESTAPPRNQNENRNENQNRNRNDITGPHAGRDRDGRLDHRYWRCERCGLESTDPRLREGCWGCDAPR